MRIPRFVLHNFPIQSGSPLELSPVQQRGIERLQKAVSTGEKAQRVLEALDPETLSAVSQAAIAPFSRQTPIPDFHDSYSSVNLDDEKIYRDPVNLEAFFMQKRVTYYEDVQGLIRTLRLAGDNTEFYLALHATSGYIMLKQVHRGEPTPSVACLRVVKKHGHFSFYGRESAALQASWHNLDPMSWPACDIEARYKEFYAMMSAMSAPSAELESVDERAEGALRAVSFTIQEFVSQGFPSLLSELFRLTARDNEVFENLEMSDEGDFENLVHFVQRLYSQYGLSDFAIKFTDDGKINAREILPKRSPPAGYGLIFRFKPNQAASISVFDYETKSWIDTNILPTLDEDEQSVVLGRIHAGIDRCFEEYKSDSLLEELHYMININATCAKNFSDQAHFRESLNDKHWFPTVNEELREVGFYAFGHDLEEDGTALVSLAEAFLCARQEIFGSFLAQYAEDFTMMDNEARKLFFEAMNRYTIERVLAYLLSKNVFDAHSDLDVKFKIAADILWRHKEPSHTNQANLRKALGICNSAARGAYTEETAMRRVMSLFGAVTAPEIVAIDVDHFEPDIWH